MASHLDSLRLATALCASIVLAPSIAAAQAPPPGPPPAYQTNLRSGLTFEVGIGLGLLRVSVDDVGSDSEIALGGPALGVGGFVTPDLALTARFAGVTYFEDENSVNALYLGPSLQYWVNDNLWLGGGIGIGIAQLNDEDGEVAREEDLGFDARIGYAFPALSNHSFSVSAEVNAIYIDGARMTGIAFLGGYQFL